jgi:hypothetical protein
LAHPNQKLSGDELFEGAPTAQIYFIRQTSCAPSERESISSRPDFEHQDTPPANVMDHSAFTYEYWEFLNPLKDDDAVTIDTAQHARVAAAVCCTGVC